MSRPPTAIRSASDVQRRAPSTAAWTPVVDGEHRLAEHDEREQAVALGDVLRVPAACGPAALGPDRHGELGGDQHEERRSTGHAAAARAARPSRPARRRCRPRSARAVRGARGRRPRRAATAPTSADPHHDVADGDDRRSRRCVNAAGRRRRGPARRRSARRPATRYGHVVGVVRRGEPREVHPRPPDGEEHQRVADDRVAGVRRRRARGAAATPAWATATTKHRSKNSSSGVDARCSSDLSREGIGRSQVRLASE